MKNILFTTIIPLLLQSSNFYFYAKIDIKKEFGISASELFNNGRML